MIVHQSVSDKVSLGTDVDLCHLKTQVTSRLVVRRGTQSCRHLWGMWLHYSKSPKNYLPNKGGGVKPKKPGHIINIPFVGTVCDGDLQFEAGSEPRLRGWKWGEGGVFFWKWKNINNCLVGMMSSSLFLPCRGHLETNSICLKSFLIRPFVTAGADFEKNKYK